MVWTRLASILLVNCLVLSSCASGHPRSQSVTLTPTQPSPTTSFTAPALGASHSGYSTHVVNVKFSSGWDYVLRLKVGSISVAFQEDISKSPPGQAQLVAIIPRLDPSSVTLAGADAGRNPPARTAASVALLYPMVSPGFTTAGDCEDYTEKLDPRIITRFPIRYNSKGWLGCVLTFKSRNGPASQLSNGPATDEPSVVDALRRLMAAGAPIIDVSLSAHSDACDVFFLPDGEQVFDATALSSGQFCV